MSRDAETREEPETARLRPSRVRGVELWDLEVGDSTLWQTMESAGFADRLYQALEDLRQGRGQCRWSPNPLPHCQGFANVWLLGGGARRIPKPNQLLGYSVVHAGDTEIASRVAAQYRRIGGLRLLVVDVGQSAIKVALGDRCWRFERDLERLPIRAPGSHDHAVDGRILNIDDQRRGLRIFLAECLRSSLEEPEIRRLDQILMALPCELGDSPLPGGSSYIGMANDDGLIAEALASAGLGHLPCRLVNDAELAALAVRHLVPAADKHLIVTLGFAIGGALILPGH